MNARYLLSSYRKDILFNTRCLISVITLQYLFHLTCASVFSFRKEVYFCQAGLKLTVLCVLISCVRRQHPSRKELLPQQKNLKYKTEY